MGKQTIAVDLDDVLSITSTAFIDFSNKRWGAERTIYDYDENWMKFWGVDNEELIIRRDVIRDEFWSNVPHSKEALPVLEQLSKKYKLVITTSRQNRVSHTTREWVDRYFKGIFEEIHHATIFDKFIGARASKETKAKLYQQIGADYIIDDHIKHCLGADAVGVKAILFGDYPWNSHAKLPETIIRLKSWPEIGEYFADR